MSALVHICRLYGLDVESPFVLGHPVPGSCRPDVRISVDDARLPVDHAVPANGRLVAEYATSRSHYALFDRGEEGHFYQIHDFACIDISPDRRDVHCQLVGDASEGLLAVILTGQVLATLLLLDGDLVFHASAVEVDGTAIAFVGNSGAGKSTLAAIACHAGAKLVTDDVLRVEPTSTAAACYRGAASLRLRPGSKALAETANGNFDGSISADGRHLLASEPTPLDRLPLAAVFIPRLQDSDHLLVRTPLDPKSALFALLQYPRVQNWTDPQTSAAHFDKLATLVQQVPVYTLDVPWGIPMEEAWFDRFADLVLDTDHDLGARTPS